MNNLIIYTERYKAVKQIASSDVVLKRIFTPKTGDIDSFIDSEIINEVFLDQKYENIFIPLSPFSGFTVCIGLRIAVHIKFSNTLNNMSNIFIYGSENINLILRNKLSDILKFKEIELIDYSYDLISEKLDSELICDRYLLERQIKKINIDIPSDYYDNHSIANEWGMYQLVRNANLNISDIIDFDQTKLNRLYFKWLQCKNKLYLPIPEEQIEEQVEYRAKLKGLNIKGKIDLSKLK